MQLPYTLRRIGPLITEADLDALESELGYKLPDSYRSFLLTTNGGYPSNEAFEKPGFPSFVLQHLYSLGGEKPYELRNMNIHGTELPPGLLRIGNSICGDPLGLGVTGEHFGKVYWQDHELAEDLSDWSAMHFLSDDFGEFMCSLKRL